MKIPSSMSSDSIHQIIADTQLKNYVSDNDIKSIQFDRNDIEQIHEEGIRAFGGSNEILNEKLLESVTEGPYGEFFGQVLCPTVFDKAAKYMFDFSNYQIFEDGNKRAGIGTANKFLKANGYDLNMSFSECYQVAIDIANHKYNDASEIVDILKNHSTQNSIYKSIPENIDKTVQSEHNDNINEENNTDKEDEGKEV